MATEKVQTAPSESSGMCPLRDSIYITASVVTVWKILHNKLLLNMRACYNAETVGADTLIDDATRVGDKTEVAHIEQIEQIHTNERVPGHENYYEKNGLRTYGDEADHDHEGPMVCIILFIFCPAFLSDYSGYLMLMHSSPSLA